MATTTKEMGKHQMGGRSTARATAAGMKPRKLKAAGKTNFADTIKQDCYMTPGRGWRLSTIDGKTMITATL
jgi:hypothetical protein